MPSITDWISSIAAIIGIPLVLVSFLKLIKKDKQKQKQLDALVKTAEHQAKINSELQKQVEQLTKHTGEFQYQSYQMYESNRLLEKQVAILGNYFLQRQNKEQERLEIEKQQRLLEIKPFFVTNGGASNPQQFTIRLHNKGGEAHNISFENQSPEVVNLNNIEPNLIVEKGKVMEITGQSISDPTNRNSNLAEFEFNLVFHDIDGNKYFQRIQRQNHRVYFDNPQSR